MLSRLDRVIAARKNSGEKREMKVSEARPIIEDIVSERLISDDAVSSVVSHIVLRLVRALCMVVLTEGIRRKC